MTRYDLVVRGGTVVTHDQVFPADVAVAGGLISAIGSDLEGGEAELDATGLHVLPGLVDAHVHLREPGLTAKGDFASETRAAAAGGVTTVMDMPNNVPPVVDIESFLAKRHLVEQRAHVDFALYGLLSGSNHLAFAALADAGCAGLKLYMGKSVGNIPYPGDGAVLEGLEAARDAGLVVGVHAENDELVELYSSRVRAEGRTDARSHSLARPPLAEEEAVARIITMAAAVGCDLHIHHVSSGAALRRAVALRRDGRPVTLEAIVAHLFLTADDYPRFGNLIKVNPPMRDRGDVEALWEAVRSGEIDMVATDHAPHTDAEQAHHDVWCAPPGFIGSETLLPILLSQVPVGRLGLPDVVRLCSWNPARRWNLAGKGRLVPGADADLAVVDLTASATITAGDLHSRYTSTPFDGLPVTGVVRYTLLGGRMVAVDGEPVGPPSGRFVRPGPP